MRDLLKFQSLLNRLGLLTVAAGLMLSSLAEARVKPKIKKAAPTNLSFKLPAMRNLNSKCTVSDVEVEFYINNIKTGSAGTTGANARAPLGQGTTLTSGIGLYGGVPGHNVLELKFPKVGKFAQCECLLIDRTNMSDPNPRTLYKFSLLKRSEFSKSYKVEFTLDAPAEK